jgi:hypothetical protein
MEGEGQSRWRVGRQQVVVLWDVCTHFFVFCVVKSGKCAINGITTEPGHVGDRRKGVLNARTSLAL